MLEESHLLETMPGGQEELSALRTVLDDEDKCLFCDCHGMLHSPFIERVEDEPILILVACMDCAIESNQPISMCYTAPQKIEKKVVTPEVLLKKTLTEEDGKSLLSLTRAVALITFRYYDPLVPIN